MNKVNDLRISWIWVEAFPGLLRNPSTLQSRWGALDSEAGYTAAFLGARKKKGEGPLTLPWPEHPNSRRTIVNW